MGDTTRKLRRGIENSDPGIASPRRELQYRIPCGGRTSQQVLDDVSRALADALSHEKDPLLVLEDLGKLQDSLMSLIKGISRLVYNYPRPVTCWEHSGYAEAFLSVMDAAEHRPPPPPHNVEPPYGSD